MKHPIFSSFNLATSLIEATVLRTGNSLTTKPLEVPVAVAQARGVVAAAPPTARVLIMVAGAGVHREGDVEPCHVVGNIAVEVEQHGPRLSNHLNVDSVWQIASGSGPTSDTLLVL